MASGTFKVLLDPEARMLINEVTPFMKATVVSFLTAFVAMWVYMNYWTRKQAVSTL